MKAQENGLTLIDIPCWWDGSVSKLVATIKFHRPDLLLSPTTTTPISSNPPIGFFLVNELPEIGELMLASFPQHNFFSNVSANLWWMGEKYDGVRGCWIPSHHKVYTRARNEILLSPKILECFPSSHLIDFEFWFGRGQFASTYGLITGDTSFTFLRGVSFDIPSRDYHNICFEDRYSLLLSAIDSYNPFVNISARIMSESQEHMRRKVQDIIETGGEGVILQQNGSFYSSGRTSTLIKVKATQGDAEAMVLDVDANKSVHLQLPNGVTFTVPKEDVHATNLSIGDVISFSYEGSARRSIPVNPKIYRHRTDLIWEDVVLSSESSTQFLVESSKLQKDRVAGFKSKPVGYWTTKKMREFLENFAKSRNLDPLNPHSWYNSSDIVYNTKDGKTLIKKFKGYYNALSQLFPEVKFNLWEFTKSNWSTVTNRKKFFEVFAKANKFDPHIPENWYKQSRKSIMALKGSKSLERRYGYDLPRVLVDTFPDIGLDLSKLVHLKSWHWKIAKNRRKFFDDFAEKRGFDALLVDNWYKIPLKEIIAEKGGAKVMYHHNSLFSALKELYPELIFEEHKFGIVTRHHWAIAKNRKKFFDDFSLAHNFDPLIADNWYSVFTNDILISKSGSSVMNYYKNSLFRAVAQLYPNVKFNRAKFSTMPRHFEALKTE